MLAKDQGQEVKKGVGGEQPQRCLISSSDPTSLTGLQPSTWPQPRAPKYANHPISPQATVRPLQTKSADTEANFTQDCLLTLPVSLAILHIISCAQSDHRNIYQGLRLRHDSFAEESPVHWGKMTAIYLVDRYRLWQPFLFSVTPQQSVTSPGRLGGGGNCEWNGPAVPDEKEIYPERDGTPWRSWLVKRGFVFNKVSTKPRDDGSERIPLMEHGILPHAGFNLTTTL